MTGPRERRPPVDLRSSRRRAEAKRDAAAVSLVDRGACGPGGLGARELAHLVDRIVAGDRAFLGGLPPMRRCTNARVVDSLRAVFGTDATAGEIDARRALDAAATAGTRLARAANARHTVVFATATPASLLPLHQRLARLTRAAAAVAARPGGDTVVVPLHLGRSAAAYIPLGEALEAAFAAGVTAGVSPSTKAPSGIVR